LRVRSPNLSHLWTDKHPLNVIPVPKELNPFHGDGVDISVALAYKLPFENIKFLTVLGLLQSANEAGKLENVTELVEATSGNTGHVLTALAPFFGIKRVTLVVPPDLPQGKREPLEVLGANLIHPLPGMSGVATARHLGGGGWKGDMSKWQLVDGVFNLDQYTYPGNSLYHRIYLGPKILEKAKDITGAVVGVGTGGTLTGVAACLRRQVDKVNIGAVILKHTFEVPGVRDRARLDPKEVGQPWEQSIDPGCCVEVETRVSYVTSLWFFWLLGLEPGPTGGFNFAGTLKVIKKLLEDGRLHRDPHTGRAHFVTVFPDTMRPYWNLFKAHLPLDLLKRETAPKPWELLW